jgi:PilZ domain
MMPHERRISIRKPLEHLVYLSLPFDNGGIVLDVSEGGLGFHAIAPVKADGPIHFRFAIDSAARIRAVGELAWKDETGKTGGLRFTQLPDEVREQIRVWAGQSKARVLDIPVAAPAIEAEAAPSGKADLAPVAATRYPLLYNLKPRIYSAPFYKFSRFPPELNSEAGATAVAVPQSVAIRNPIAAVGLTIALAFLVSMGICAYVSTSRAGELLFDWGEKMRGGFYSQPIPRGPAPPVSSAPDPSKTIQQ